MTVARYSVVAGIFRKDGKILMGRRHDREGRFAGFWEFPGGKIEDGESDEVALCREFQEELECNVISSTHFKTVSWEYPDRIIELKFFLVELDHVDVSRTDLSAHSELKWVSVDEALASMVLPANRQIIEALSEA